MPARCSETQSVAQANVAYNQCISVDTHAIVLPSSAGHERRHSIVNLLHHSRRKHTLVYEFVRDKEKGNAVCEVVVLDAEHLRCAVLYTMQAETWPSSNASSKVVSKKNRAVSGAPPYTAAVSLQFLGNRLCGSTLLFGLV